MLGPWLRRIETRARAHRRVGSVLSAFDRFLDHDGEVLAGHLAFSAMLAIFPFLIFLAALAGFLGDAQSANGLIDLLFRFAPADVAETLAPPVRAVLETRSGGLLTLGILGTVWIASGGLEALRIGLNKAYDVTEPRPLWWRRLQSIGLVILFAFGLLAASLTVILGPIIWAIVDSLLHIDDAGRVIFVAARYALGAAALFCLVFGVHQLLPNRVIPWRTVIPGIMVTLVLWLLVSTAMSIYLGTLADYGATYGTLGGIVVTLLFFYVMAVVFIFGAELNGALAAQRLERPEQRATEPEPASDPG